MGAEKKERYGPTGRQTFATQHNEDEKNKSSTNQRRLNNLLWRENLSSRMAGRLKANGLGHPLSAW
jgi:hypothetical protein